MQQAFSRFPLAVSCGAFKRELYVGAAVAVVALGACGDSGVSGNKYGGPDCLFDSIEFTSGDSGYMTQFGVQSQFSYTRDGDRVIVTMGTDNAVFTLDDDGALDGGALLGKCVEIE